MAKIGPFHFHLDRDTNPSIFHSLHGCKVGMDLGRERQPYGFAPFISFNWSWRSWDDDRLMVPYLVVVRGLVYKSGKRGQRCTYIGIHLIDHARYEVSRLNDRFWRTLRQIERNPMYLRRSVEVWLRDRKEAREWADVVDQKCEHGIHIAVDFCEKCENSPT